MKNKILLTAALLSGLTFHTAVANANAEGWKLVWSDEFDYTGSPVNDKDEWYFNKEESMTREARFVEENAYCENGDLIIEAKYHGPGDYSSSGIATRASYTAGKLEMRAKLPYSKGMWPAFWTINAPGSAGGGGYREIDVMELVGGGAMDSRIYGTAHWGPHWSDLDKSGSVFDLTSGTYADDYHIFGVNWDSTQIEFYVDDSIYHTAILNETAKGYLTLPQEVRLNLAVGGSWPGSPNSSTVWPQKFYIDYVRIYEKVGTSTLVNTQKTTTTSLSTISRSGLITFQGETGVQIQRVSLYDMQGKMIQSISGDKQQSISISGATLPKSMLLAKVQLSNGEEKTLKVSNLK